MQGWKCRGGDSGVEMQGGDAGAEMQGWRCRNKNAGVEMMEWRCRSGDAGVETQGQRNTRRKYVHRSCMAWWPRIIAE